MQVREYLARVVSGSIDVVESAHKTLDSLQKIDEAYHYMNTISSERLLCDAKALQAQTDKGPLGGLFVSVKDSICVKGVESRAGSRILTNYKPPFDATCVAKGVNAGALVVGKTAQDEFGFGAFSVNVGEGFRVPKNPLDPTRVCGGSSGGAAGLAAKADFAHVAYGESTGGSIVNPASFCGVFGLCPTYGRVSRYGLIDYGNSLDKVGPLGKSLYEVALLQQAISGYDAKDSTSVHKPVDDYVSSLSEDVSGLRVGVVADAFSEDLDPVISKLTWKAIHKLESLGATYKEVSVPLSVSHGVATYYLVSTSEASTNLAKLCGLRYGVAEELQGSYNEFFTTVRSKHFGKEVKRRILLGTFARMAGYRDAYYLRALKVRSKICSEYASVFKGVDVLASPTVPMLPPTFSTVDTLTPLQHYMADLLTVGPNLAGLPHLNVPVGSYQGLSVGALFVANHFAEKTLFRAGAAFDPTLG